MDLPQVIEKWEEFSITTTKNINKNKQEKNRTVELTAITFQLCETDQTSTHLPRIVVTFHWTAAESSLTKSKAAG